MLDINEQYARLKNILFLDIETVSEKESYGLVDERLKPFWDKKSTGIYSNLNKTSEELYFEKSAIYAEFGKIIVIGLGFFYLQGSDLKLKVKSIYGHDEKLLLEDFKSILVNSSSKGQLVLCAHNGKEFDFPYLSRRMLINRIVLPTVLDVATKKPWEVNHLDTMEMWKFGDKKNFTSLDLLATLFNIPTSKDLMDGSMVNTVYYQEGNLQKIADYCKKDVITLAQLYLALNCIELVDLNYVDII